MFEWDRHNLRKIGAHRIKREETEQALQNDPIPIFEQDVEGERRFVYYGETNAGRLLGRDRDRARRQHSGGDGLRSERRAEARVSQEACGRRVKPMSKKTLQMPRFKSESEEADWWASPAGRAYVKQKSAEVQSKGAQARGSSLVAKLNKKSSIQIAIRLPGADLAQARKIADRKGIGYQTLLKMLVREGLAREARRR